MKRRSQDHIGESEEEHSPARKKVKLDDTPADPKKKEPTEKEQLSTYIKNERTIEVLKKKGIHYFFPIQYETYNILYKGKDLIARDRTGSGKTIAFSLPIIERFREEGEFGSYKTKMLIVLPTRELAIQVKNEIVSIRHKSSEFSVVNVYGGADMHEQIREIREGADIIVATPGRLLDLLRRDIIKLGHLKVTVLDEADEMLKQGFDEDIEQIFKFIDEHLKKKTQNLLFSATIPPWVLEIARKYLDPSTY